MPYSLRMDDLSNILAVRSRHLGIALALSVRMKLVQT